MESVRRLAWRDLLAAPQQLLLGSCLAVLALLIGWEAWVSASAALYHPSVTPVAAANNPAQDQNAVERITGADLFGHAPATQAGGQAPPETNLQLVLRGVFSASDPSQASAIIETGDGHTQMVKVGVAVAAGTVLQQVFDNRVLLAHNGAIETLYFPTATDTEGQSDLTNNAPIDSGQVDASPEAAPAANDDLSTEQKRANILKRLEELRTRSSR